MKKYARKRFASLRAGVIEFEKSGAGRAMTDEDGMKILLTAAKKRREAIEIYDQNNRPELAEKERAELAVIQEYLPKQMSKEEVAARVKASHRADGADRSAGRE